MQGTDDHEFVELMKAYAEASDDEGFRSEALQSFIRCDAAGRRERLAAVAKAGRETEASLRQEAQLLSFTRMLADAHETLSRAGR